MADYGFIANPQTPSGVQTLSSLVNLTNDVQRNKLMQQEYQSNDMKLQAANQANNERQSAINYISNKANYTDQNGNINLEGMRQDLMKLAPQTWENYYSPVVSMHNNTSIANQAAQNFDTSTRNIVSGTLGVLGRAGITDPKAYNAELDRLGAAYKDDQHVQKYIGAAKDIIKNVDPKALPNMATTASQSLIAPSEQQGALSPRAKLVDTGAGINQVIEFPSVAGSMPGVVNAGQAMPKTVSPSEQQTTFQNPVDNNFYVQHKDASGNITGTTPLPGAMPSLQPGDKEAIPQLTAERDAARNSFLSVGAQHENNRIILSNIDNVKATGVSGQAFRSIASAMGFNPGDAKDPATAYDLVGKGLERSAIQAAQSMGPQTNAGLQAQIQANGSLSYTPEAIKKITKLNDALTTGVESYQPGLEKAIQSAGPNGVLAKRQFDQQWGQNFDPRIYMLYNAQKSGDKKEVNDIVNSLGGKNSKTFQELLIKAGNIQKLSQQGHL